MLVTQIVLGAKIREAYKEKKEGKKSSLPELLNSFNSMIGFYFTELEFSQESRYTWSVIYFWRPLSYRYVKKSQNLNLKMQLEYSV